MERGVGEGVCTKCGKREAEQLLLEWFGKDGTVVDMCRGLNDAGQLNRWGCGKRCGRRGVHQVWKEGG